MQECGKGLILLLKDGAGHVRQRRAAKEQLVGMAAAGGVDIDLGLGGFDRRLEPGGDALRGGG